MKTLINGLVMSVNLYNHGSGFGYGDGYGSGYGYGYGYGSGFGSGFGYGDGHGYGSGDGYGDGYGDKDWGSVIGAVSDYKVVYLAPWPYVKVGCEVHHIDHWRERWQDIADKNKIDINQKQAEEILGKIAKGVQK